MIKAQVEMAIKNFTATEIVENLYNEPHFLLNYDDLITFKVR